jgi:hypothetical protein
MPSKKKARSQARKAKKEEAGKQATRSSDSGSRNANPGDGSSCNHLNLPENRTLEDFKEACALCTDFDTNYGAYFERMGVAFGMEGENCSQFAHGEIVRMSKVIQYIHLQMLARSDDANNEVFRQLLISKGIGLILDAQKIGRIQFVSSEETETRRFMNVLLPITTAINLIDARN